MSRKLYIILPVLVLAAIVCTVHKWNNEPPFIVSAEERVGSYLTSDYGKVICNNRRINSNHYELDCRLTKQHKNFLFAVSPSEYAPYSVARSFYLEAMNKNAMQCADKGLMRYLQINDQPQKG